MYRLEGYYGTVLFIPFHHYQQLFQHERRQPSILQKMKLSLLKITSKARTSQSSGAASSADGMLQTAIEVLATLDTSFPFTPVKGLAMTLTEIVHTAKVGTTTLNYGRSPDTRLYRKPKSKRYK
jgi:hypothetical protein